MNGRYGGPYGGYDDYNSRGGGGGGGGGRGGRGRGGDGGYGGRGGGGQGMGGRGGFRQSGGYDEGDRRPPYDRGNDRDRGRGGPRGGGGAGGRARSPRYDDYDSKDNYMSSSAVGGYYGANTGGYQGGGGGGGGYGNGGPGPGPRKDDYGYGPISPANRETSGPPEGQTKKRRTEQEDAVIEERVSRERPCRTLFVRNIKYETRGGDVREKFERMGDIKTFFDLIGNRGMVFITYFDIRAAMRAKEELQGSDVLGRSIDVHYSLPRDEDLSKRCDREKNQGTLFVVASDAKYPINDSDFRQMFARFGEIKSMKPYKNNMNQRFVEYFDSRACESAYDELIHKPYNGGKLDLKFAWDYGAAPRQIPDAPSAPPKGRDSKGHDRDPRDFRDRDDDRDRPRGGRERDSGYGPRGPRDEPRGGYGPRAYGDSPVRGGGRYYGGSPSPLPPPVGYGTPPPPRASDPVHDRLEQAKTFQNLLSALAQPSQAAAPAPPAPAPQHFGAPPAAQFTYPALAQQQPAYQAQPPAPANLNTSALPPNILALLQQTAQAAARPAPPPPQPVQSAPAPAAQPAATAANVQNLLALLAQQQNQNRR